MDRLKKARKPVRASITRTINEVEVILTGEQIDKDVLLEKHQKLDDLLQSVIEMDQQVIDALLDNDCTEEEHEEESLAIEEYRDKIRKYKIAMNKVLNPRERSISPAPSGFSTATSGAETKRNYKLPKIEIKKFDGNLTEWLGFWSQFQKVHEDESLHASDKFQYLIQSMVVGTKARELVESYPQTAGNYPKVIEALKERFGKEKLLRQVYVRELLKMVLGNAKSKEKVTLSKMFDRLESHLRALESLGITLEQSAEFLYPMVESSLPEETLIAWQRSSFYGKDGTKENPKKSELNYLMKFLKQEVESEELRILAGTGFVTSSNENKPKGHKSSKGAANTEDFPTAAGLFTGHSQSCIFCEKTHESRDCGKADSLTLEEKKAKVQAKGVCYNFLKPGHSSKKCKSFVKCLVCQRKHCTIMCPNIQRVNRKTPEVKDTQTVATTLNYTSEVLLQTLVVKAIGKNSNCVVRVLFDSGSQKSYIRKSTATRLNYTPSGQVNIRQALFGGSVTNIKRHNKYHIQLQSLDGESKKELEALDEEVVCGTIPRLTRGPWLNELNQKGITLNDFHSDSPDIEILVGSDYLGNFLTGKVEKLKSGLIAMETVFGWTISGKIPIQHDSMAMTITTLFVNNATIPELWNLETIGIIDSAASKSKKESELAANKHFLKTVTRNEDGRYSVSLPWTNGTQEIPNNRYVAEKRLITTTTKLQAAGEYENYDQIFNSWLSERIIEEVPVTEDKNPSHYLPHRPVFKPASLTTPVRPVFDASCKTGRSPSLNDCLEKGPNQLEVIPSILLRFREKKIGVISDIRKAFQMIEVNSMDRDFLRFLWWDNPSKSKLKEYRHRRVVFGVNCSPFLLSAVLENHLCSVQDERQEIAMKLFESLYVDNCVTSVNSFPEYEEFKHVGTQLMAEAGMELRQWECTSPEKLTKGGGSANDSQMILVLGLMWNKQKDVLSCVIPNEVPNKICKRSILSLIQKIYDPLGLLCPALLLPKLVIQKAWALRSGWDDELDTELLSEFQKWWSETPLLSKIEVPRNTTGGVRSREKYQIHCFCDASKLAYATAVFLRTEDNGIVTVQLLQAKARVAPLKKVTIPRLELLACTIGARLTPTVQKALLLTDVPTTYWSDSTTTLAWINRNDDWGTFVGNRVKEICSLTHPKDWRHVPGVMNPADLPSRGCSPSFLLHNKWWEGPDWLKGDKRNWPSGIQEVDEEAVQSEKRKNACNTLVVTEESSPWYVQRYSSYTENIRLVAWIRRYLDKLRRRSNEVGELKLSEIQAAERNVFKLVQKEVFIPKDGVICGLHVIEEEGIYRVNTKLFYRDDTRNFVKPVLLPSCHPLVEQLIREKHLTYHHAGVQFQMSELRERYWILQGRKVVKKVIKNCVICRRFGGKSPSVPEAPLPEDRVKTAKVFETTGVDLAGPLYLKDKNKTWIVLFTCAVYRCVHLELVLSLNTDSFLMALHRFISRRGRPTTINSDNGTNFVGSVNGFKQLDWKRIERETRVHRIQWKFNPPSAAWWGGWWERLIRTLKDLLKRMLGHQKLTYVQLETCVCEAEAVMNHRPLTYVTEDQDDLIPLTPAMFIQDVQESSFPEAEILGGDGLRSSYKQLNKMKEELRVRFRKEYLAQLVHRGKSSKSQELKVGDVVLVESDNKKRLDWPMAKITELLPGKDGKVRVARIKTSSGFLLRPLQRLFPLEVSSVVNPPISPEAKKRGIQVSKEIKLEDPEVRTHYGRIVKKPSRFEQ